MLTRPTDEEWTLIATLSPVWLWLSLPHETSRVRVRTGAAGPRWRRGELALSGALRR
jgi:hypothetical protein